MSSRVVAYGAQFGRGFVRYFFSLEFVYGLLHVRLYLGWDLSDFIYLFISEFVSGPLLSQFFFFKIVLVLLNWSLIKLGLLNYFFF
jgi:hypothetical protein